MLKALIFDFDGLILDTETPEYQALSAVYAEYGQHLSAATYGKVVGSEYNLAEYEPVAHLQELTGKMIDRTSFFRRVDAQRLGAIERSSALPGVEALIHASHARGLKLAVASSSPHAWVDGHLRRLGLFSYFDAIKCREDVLQIKPAPDLFLAALGALQVQASEAVIFEDSRNGVLAARLAGIRVIAIPNPVTIHTPIEGETLRLNSLADISLDELLQMT